MFMSGSAVDSPSVSMMLFRADILREMRIAKKEQKTTFLVAIPSDVSDTMLKVIIDQHMDNGWHIDPGNEEEGCLHFSAT